MVWLFLIMKRTKYTTKLKLFIIDFFKDIFTMETRYDLPLFQFMVDCMPEYWYLIPIVLVIGFIAQCLFKRKKHH